MTEHWFDRLARETADGRVTRRQVLLQGVRMLAAVTVGGGLYGLTARRALAQGTECHDKSNIPQECIDLAGQAQAAAAADCKAGSTNYALCIQNAMNAGYKAELQCVNEPSRRLQECGRCKFCNYGTCVSICGPDCMQCDPEDETCSNACPPGYVCDVVRGGCAPACPYPCAPYDPALDACRDDCHQITGLPCMSCYQGICQSNCPDPTQCCQDHGNCAPADPLRCQQLAPTPAGLRCRGCDPKCQKCENGTCVDLCTPPKVCCFGQCEDCCMGGCNWVTGQNNCSSCGGALPYCLIEQHICSACTTVPIDDPRYKQCGPAGAEYGPASEGATCCLPGQECCQWTPGAFSKGALKGKQYTCYDPKTEYCCPTVGPCTQGWKCFGSKDCGCCPPHYVCVEGDPYPLRNGCCDPTIPGAICR